MPLLMRGPLLSLPIALATDYPPIQVMSMALVFLVFLVVECRAWPWKVPLLNLLDTMLCMIMTMLVGSSSLHLGAIEGSMKDLVKEPHTACVISRGSLGAEFEGFSMMGEKGLV